MKFERYGQKKTGLFSYNIYLYLQDSCARSARDFKIDSYINRKLNYSIIFTTYAVILENNKERPVKISIIIINIISQFLKYSEVTVKKEKCGRVYA